MTNDAVTAASRANPSPTDISRRSMLTRLAAGLAAGTALQTVTGAPAWAQGASPTATNDAVRRPARRVERVGLQLYTVRSAMAKNPESAIAAVAKAGVREVEFAGYYNKPAVWWRKLLGAHELTTPSTHIGFPKTDAEWAPHFAMAKEMEHNWVIVPWIPLNAKSSADDWKRIADRLNVGGEMAERAGLNFGYHNHDFEFAPVRTAGTNASTTGYEILMEHTERNLVDFELDIYWAVKAGQDPLAMFDRWGDRYPLCHVKDAGPPPERAMVDVGAGTIDFAAIIERGRPTGLRHWFIEHDNPTDAMKSVRASALALSNL